MTRKIRFHVAGNPIPKGRPRVVNYPDRTFAFTPKRTRAWEAEVSQAARQAMAGADPMAGDLGVEITFTRADRRRVDLDNLAKAVLDALNGIAYQDDDQVVTVVLHKRHDPDKPGARITVWGIDYL